MTFPRVVRRTVRRSLSRQKLWNGNTEGSLRTLFTDPEHIIRWAVASRHSYRERIPALAETAPHLRVVRLRHPREARAWVSTVWPAGTDAKDGPRM